jgi:hypothetical protein
MHTVRRPYPRATPRRPTGVRESMAEYGRVQWSTVEYP